MSFNRSQGNSSKACFLAWQKLSHSGISGHVAPDKNGKCEVFLTRNAKLQKEIWLSYVKQMHEVNATVIKWESERLQDKKSGLNVNFLAVHVFRNVLRSENEFLLAQIVMFHSFIHI